VIAVLSVAQFVLVLDTTAINVSISEIVKDLDTSVEAVQFAITAVSQNAFHLLLGWALIDGIGAALMVPAMVALVADNHDGNRRVVAYGILGAVAASASAAGPLLGALALHLGRLDRRPALGRRLAARRRRDPAQHRLGLALAGPPPGRRRAGDAGRLRRLGAPPRGGRRGAARAARAVAASPAALRPGDELLPAGGGDRHLPGHPPLPADRARRSSRWR
jgi:MFS family permease